MVLRPPAASFRHPRSRRAPHGFARLGLRALVLGVTVSAWCQAAPAEGAGAQAHRSSRPPPMPQKRAADEQDSPIKGATLTLADAVFLGLRDNRAIRSAYIDRIAQKFDLRVAEDRFSPQLGVSGSAVRQSIGAIGTSTVQVSPGASILLPTGATLGFAWNTSFTDVAGTQTRRSTADVTISQPLLRGGGTEVTMAPLGIARLTERINRLNLKRTVSNTIGQVILAYRSLLQAQESWQLAQNSLKRARELVDVNRSLIQAGRMAAVEIVQSEANVENQQIRVLAAARSIEIARLNLLQLLSIDLGTAVIAGESTSPERLRPDLRNVMRIALSERPDFLGQLCVVEQNRLGLTVAENQKLWDLSVFASGSFGGRTVTSAAAKDSQRIADGVIGVQFNMPLTGLQREQPAVQASTALRTSELQLAAIRQGVELQVRSAVTDIEMSWSQIEVARKARTLAERALAIENEKLRAGRSSAFQIRALEADLRDAEQQQLNSAIAYLNALTTLDMALGTTLKTWHIDLAD